MALPRRLQGCTHLFSFLSVLASSRNSIRPHIARPTPHLRNWDLSSRISVRALGTPANSYRRLRLQPKDRAVIDSYYDASKPRKLRTQEDFLKALRSHGYVPAVDRVDEMLDMNRSPFQSKDEFDKLTLGLLLRSAKSANGEIRNPYKIPSYSAGQNPVRTKTGKFPRLLPPNQYFLFPDDTNWSIISKYFPLQEPPRPWHPITMTGLKQDYTREEVARRLEWSQVQNAKKLRNGYTWPAPDPATYEYLERLPAPPPPVIRECNVCKRPRYLMRFWNFYFQRWQHVAAPHRPSDCYAHKKGGGGRLMYAPKGTKIGGLTPSHVENKEWIDEETAVRLLFRSGFITLPTINPVLGRSLADAAVNKGDMWSWIDGEDTLRWALRGGRKNGLIDFSNVKRMGQVEQARKEQQQQFLEEHKELLNEIREILKQHPITPEDAAKIPLGQFYPAGHPAVAAWRRFEWSKVKESRARAKGAEKAKTQHNKKLRAKLKEVDEILDEMRVTKAEILMLERGQGEAWADPNFASLKTIDRAGKIQSEFNLDRMIMDDGAVVRRKNDDNAEPHDPDRRGPYRTWEYLTREDQLRAPTRWLEKAAERSWISDAPGSVTESSEAPVLASEPSEAPVLASEPSRVPDLIDEPSDANNLIHEPTEMPNLENQYSDDSATGLSSFSTYPSTHPIFQRPRRPVDFVSDLEDKPAPFTKKPVDELSLYQQRFRESLRLKSLNLNLSTEEDKDMMNYIKDKLEGPERKAIRREESAFTLREAYLWQNTGKPVPGGDGMPVELHGTRSESTESVASESGLGATRSRDEN